MTKHLGGKLGKSLCSISIQSISQFENYFLFFWVPSRPITNFYKMMSTYRHITARRGKKIKRFVRHTRGDIFSERDPYYFLALKIFFCFQSNLVQIWARLD